MNATSATKMAVQQAKKIDPVVSIIIPAYNATATIVPCLQSVYSQNIEVPYQVIVVDSSTDDTPSIIKDKFPQVTLIHLSQQTYPGTARNIGVQHAQGQVLAFLDSDCIAAPNWLERCLEQMKNGHVIIGGAIANANPQKAISIADYLLTFNEFLPSTPSRRIMFMPSCNLLCAKNVFDDIGGFSDHLVGEDTLFCQKAQRDYSLYFDAQAQVMHTNRTSFKKFISHHSHFGQGSALIRKTTVLPGSLLAKSKVLALLAPVIRSSRLSWRLLRWNYRHSFQMLRALPYLVVGISAWGAGFVKEAWKKR